MFTLHNFRAMKNAVVAGRCSHVTLNPNDQAQLVQPQTLQQTFIKVGASSMYLTVVYVVQMNHYSDDHAHISVIYVAHSYYSHPCPVVAFYFTDTCPEFLSCPNNTADYMNYV